MGSRKVNRWNLRGWKHEPNYSPQTLVGDWYEERREFPRGSMSCFTTYNMDYQKFASSRDWHAMWKTKTTQEGGMGRKHLMDHHSDEYLKERISTYNLEYSVPAFKMQSSRYQPRKWDRHRCLWRPEKLDLPLPKENTLYGMIQQMKNDLQDDPASEKNAEKSFVLPQNLPLQEATLNEPKLSYKHKDVTSTMIRSTKG